MGWNHVTDLVMEEYLRLLLQDDLGSLFFYTVKCCLINFPAFGSTEQKVQACTHQHPSCYFCQVTSLANTHDLVPLSAICAHATTLPLPCLTDTVVCLGWQSVSLLLLTFLFQCSGSSWSRFHLCKDFFIFPPDLCSFKCFLVKSKLVFLFDHVISGLHLTVNLLYIHSWTGLLIVNNDTFTLWISVSIVRSLWPC